MKSQLFLARRGVTLVEAIVGTAIIAFIFYMISSFTGNMAFKYKHTFIELENFREAHSAINHLRRDFNMSCPFVDKKDGIKEMKAFIEKPFAITRIDAKYVGANQRIRITPNQLVFFKFADTAFSESSRPLVEEIEYSFDKSTGKLFRKANNRKTSFEGFKDFEFQAFVHQANDQVPVIWVKMVLDQNVYKDASFGKPLELTTSISSKFVADAINYNSWRYSSYHNVK